MEVDEKFVAVEDKSTVDEGGQSEDDSTIEQSIQIGFHPLGGIRIGVKDTLGGSASARIGAEEAWRMAGHLNSLATILIQMAYAQAQMEAESASSLYVPGR